MKDFYRSCHSLVLCALLAVMCVFTATHAMAAPITWTGKASMPTPRSRAASGVINGKIFVLGGDTAGSTAVEMYDPAKDTWQPWPPLAQPIFAPCQVTLGDTIYMVGMNSSQVVAYRTFIHAGSPNPLPVPSPYGFSEVVGNLNTTRSNRAQAALVNKKMYIVGTGPNMDQIEEFDLTTFTSVTKNTRLPAGRDLPMVAAFDGRIYIMGGINGGVATTTIWQYDPVSDSIFETGSLPSPMAGNMVATWGGKIYIAGANTNGAAPPAWDGTLWEYDVRGSFWNSYDAVPTSRYAAAVQVWNGSLYVIGGDSGGDTPTSLATNEAALLPSGSPRWSVRDTNSPQVVHPSIATVDGKIFMLGGRTSINFSGQRDVYSIDPTAPAPSWQRMPDLASPILASPAAVYGQKIYLAGGESLNGSSTADILFYDTATTPYTSGIAVSLRYPRAKAGAAILNNRLYVIGGGTAAIEEFDLTTTPITRTERVDYLPEALIQPTVIAANGRIYIMGGTVASGPAAYTITDVCLVYDPWGPPGTFTPCAPMPVAVDENEGAALIDGKIYLVGGGTNALYSPNVTTAVQKYDLLNDSWEVSDTMTNARRDHGIASTNGHIYVMGGWLNGGGYWANTTEEYIVPFIWRVNSYNGDAVDWPSSLHGTVPTGSYLLIGGKYYYVRASYPGSWSGQGFNMAVLQQCDQYSGAPLYDPANPGMPLAPDLSGTIFQSIDLVTVWQPRVRPPWTVTSIDPGSISGIDWPAATHGPVTPGTYLQVGTTIYYVMASGSGSWRGGDYVYAYLYNCDQKTGQVIDYGANMAGSVGATISAYLFPPQISVSPQSFDFGTTTFPFISGAQMFSIGNFGGAPLVVSSMGIAGIDAGHFSISSYDTCGSAPTLAPGSSCSIFIVYAPQDTGTRNAMLQVVSNDPTTPTATVPLSGNSALVPLTLSFAGTGSGTVAFSNGDSCAGSCSRSFTATTTLTLTANAAPGAQFTGWTGCGPVTGNQCTMSMMSAQNVTATFDLLPPPAEVWSTKAPMPTGLSRAFSAVVNGSIFVLGGSPTTATVQRYNPQSDTWAQQSPLPTPLFGGAAAAQGQIIYLAGGFNSAMDFQNGILAYDTVTGSTQQVGTLVTARARVNGTILNNRLYVVGGSNALSSIEEFDLSTGSSSTIATLPEPTELAAVIGNLNDLYIFGGGADNTKSWRFDTVSRTFYPLTPSPVSVRARSVTFDSGRALLVDTWGFSNVNNVLEYSFQFDSWKIITTVPTLRNVPMVEAVDGILYVIGGDSAAGTTNEAWRFSTAPVVSHTVTPVAGPNGSILPTTPQSVPANSAISFTILPYPGYHISSVSGCGGTLSGTTFTTGPITADCTVNALFAADSSGDICTKVDMVWYSGGSEIRRDYNCASAQASPSGYCYSFQTDACSGYRCVSGNEITPACYSEAQCAAACGGQCVQIQTQKTSCASLPASYPVLVTISGGGTVHSSVTPDINCSSGTCSQSYPSGTSIQLTASPAAGADFVSWVGCDSVAGTVCTIGNLGAARRLTATFVASGTPAFTPGASMTVAREFHTATLLPNGKVLVAGGWPGLATAELYDPATDSWTPAANLTVGRHSHTATLLSSGKVLVAGGYPNKTSAELYDPATNSWSPVGNLATGRSAHTATRLADGKVLVAAGYDPTANVPIASAEVYDPASGTWSPAGTLVSGRQWHTATRLASGKILVVGGSTTHSASNALATGELYDPASNSWTAAGNLANSRQQHTATILGNGKVLIAGGWGSGGMQATVEVYDPATGTWSSTGSLAKARFFHTATVLATGKVLVAGGYIATYEENGPLASAEIFDPVTGTWSSAGNLAYAREYHSETLLADGRILIVGGSNSQGTLASAELFGTLATSHQLTVTLAGSGQGTVHSTPAPDIACLSGVCSQSYAPGTGVTLTATPASGFTFVGWGDDCSGTGTCQVTMNAGKTVKATFAPKGDTVQPAITSFTMPASASTLTVPVTTFIASDNVAVTGYLIGESAVPPAAGAAGWTSTPPTSFTFLAPGNCYAYAWVKDGAGNVSAASIAMVDITIANPVDTVAPVITTFSLGAPNAQSVSVTLAVTDNVGVTGYLLSEDPSMPLSNDSRWRSAPPSSFTFASYGNKTLYAWAKDASDNISAGVMATTLIMDPEAALNTVITGWPANPMPYSPSVFTFIASRASAGFECSLDNQGYFPCASPISFGSLANGSHTFSVRAKDGSVTDDTPATFTWTVQLPLVQVLLNTYPSVLDAYLTTADGASLKIKGIEFREDLVFDRPVAITLQGGYDAAYLNTDGTSVIHGSIAIGQGTVTIDNITIM